MEDRKWGKRIGAGVRAAHGRDGCIEDGTSDHLLNNWNMSEKVCMLFVYMGGRRVTEGEIEIG